MTADPARTPLGERIARLIAASGPISLAEYMHMAMADPQHGYYAARQALGAAGDFVTAPEISQMFGELIGVWCASLWRAAGAPSPFILAEAGPGRGTLMADLLRATGRVAGFRQSARIRLIETSPRMIAAQQQALAGFDADIGWAGALQELEDGPLILIANEFLDVLPTRQYVRSGPVWRERMVGLSDSGALSPVLGPSFADPSWLPGGHEQEGDGAVYERSPAREAFVEMLAARLAGTGGAALLIDYGHAQGDFGDTFQAVRAHARADPFAAPGEADLTSHVDFASLARAAIAGGAAASRIVSQGEFLLSMGLRERAERLAAAKSPGEQAHIVAAAQRLAAEQEMGGLFKVFALAAPQWRGAADALPPFACTQSGCSAD